MRTALRLLAAVCVLALGATAAQAAGQTADAKTKIKVIGFAAIYDNDDHIVRAKNRGVLRRCDEPRSLTVVLDVSNIEEGLPFQQIWTRNGKVILNGDPGTTGSFDAKPTRIKLGFRKRQALPDGRYVFKLKIDGKVVATGKVRRDCR